MNDKSSKAKGKDKSPKLEESQPQTQEISTPTTPESEQPQEPVHTPEPARLRNRGDD